MNNKNNNKKKPSIGGLVGHSEGGRIENCHFEGTIKIEGDAKSVNVGGLVGSSKDTIIVDSTSKANIQISDDERFEKLKKEIEDKIEDKEKVQILLNQTSEMQKTKKTKSFLQNYQKFISTAADHMTVIAPFIPFLTQMIVI